MRFTVTAMAMTVFCTGCGLMGPAAINASRSSYNDVLQTTGKEQLLLNVVRSHFDEPVQFFDVTTVSSQFTLTGTAGTSFTFPDRTPGGAQRSFGGTASGTFTDSPTILYTPLQGANFVQQMLSPISLQTIVALYDSGWPVDDLFSIMVQRLSDRTVNSPEAGVINDNFKAAVQALRTLQALGAVDLGVIPGKTPSSHDEAAAVAPPPASKPPAPSTPDYLVFTLQLNSVADSMTERAAKAWDDFFFAVRGEHAKQSAHPASIEVQSFVVTPKNPPASGPSDEQTIVRVRSAMGAIHYVGLDITDAKTPQSTEHPAPVRTAAALDIRHSVEEPPKAYVKVRYAGSWYYLPGPDDSTCGTEDARSRRNFALLSQLITSQATAVQNSGLLLTVPVGQR